MKSINYDPISEENARSSWYLGTRDEFVLKIIKKFTNLKTTAKILDAGCGTGGVMSGLKNNGISIIGNDLSLESLFLGKKSGRIIECIQASNTHLPFKDKTFDITITSEVLEHVQDDLLALNELCRITKQKIIFTVPAHEYLWTSSDDSLLHKRRYSKLELEELANKLDLRIERLRPYGVIPAVLVVFYKLISKIRNKTQEDKIPFTSRYIVPKIAEKLLAGIFTFDLWLSEKGLILWGHSWWGVFVKQDDIVN